MFHSRLTFMKIKYYIEYMKNISKGQDFNQLSGILFSAHGIPCLSQKSPYVVFEPLRIFVRAD